MTTTTDHRTHCRTHVVLGATCNCDTPAPQPDPEVPLCTERIEWTGNIRVHHPVKGPRPTVTSPGVLNQLQPGRRVQDAVGDVWTRREDGWWSFDELTTSPEHLLHVWGPVYVMPREEV